MCKAIQDIRNDALAEGERNGWNIGEDLGESRFAKLVRYLLDYDKLAELDEAIISKEKRKTLYEMYNIAL